jgi:hypothetical protein
LQAINFVEKEGAHAVGDERVKIFEDEVAGCFLAGFVKDLSKCKLGRDEAV